MIPDKPGYWWCQWGNSNRHVVEVSENENGEFIYWIPGQEQSDSVNDGTTWLGPVESTYLDVLEFHQKFAPSIIGTSPRVPDFECYDVKFIEEELAELKEAMAAGDMARVADALGDIQYVTNRFAVIWGIDLRPIHDVIHAANMRKVGGELRADKKVMKPPGWTPPDVRGLLIDQGWTPPDAP